MENKLSQLIPKVEFFTRLPPIQIFTGEVTTRTERSHPKWKERSIRLASLVLNEGEERIMCNVIREYRFVTILGHPAMSIKGR